MVGGGIVGLATAFAVAPRSGRSVAVVEREAALGTHQSGNNSNVIHSGLYYAPGSLKARLAVPGNRETVAFCRRTTCRTRCAARSSSPRSPTSCRGWQSSPAAVPLNGVEVNELTVASSRTHEPHVRAIAALTCRPPASATSGASPRQLGKLLGESGVEILTGHPVGALERRGDDVVVRGPCGELLARAGRRLRRSALRRAGEGLGRRPGRADHPVPRRVLQRARPRPPTWSAVWSTRSPTRRSRSSACTPRAGSTVTSTSAQRRAGAGSRGILVAGREAAGAGPHAGLPGPAPAGAQALALRAR